MPSTTNSPEAEKPIVALVTGAGTGIGRAIVLRLARQGYTGQAINITGGLWMH